MEAKKNVLTYGGLKKLEDELQFLKVEERKRIAEKIKEAVAQGDLTENAEYDSAKDEQRDERNKSDKRCGRLPGKRTGDKGTADPHECLVESS